MSKQVLPNEVHAVVGSVLDKMQLFAKNNRIEYTTSPDAPSTWDELKKCDPRKLVVYDGASELTIWGRRGNHLFRAVHDFIHIKYGLSFEDADEIEVRRLTCALLALNPIECRVMETEIDKQIEYKNEWGWFPSNQIAFFLINFDMR